MKKTSAQLAHVAALLGVASFAFAHPGGLNREGCHNDRKHGTGYHCHRGQTRLKPDVGTQLVPGADRVSPAASGAFANCDAARAAGAAPVRRSDPGYGPHLDRDGDGIGCEPYRGRR